MNKKRVLEIIKMEHQSRERDREVEIFGWYGVVAILLAYFLVSFNLIDPTGFFFQFLNLTGGLGLTAIAFLKKDYQLVVVNAVWAVIALVALVVLLIHVL